jgi:hypothetical protein
MPRRLEKDPARLRIHIWDWCYIPGAARRYVARARKLTGICHKMIANCCQSHEMTDFSSFLETLSCARASKYKSAPLAFF